jgi:hypothetical protein
MPLAAEHRGHVEAGILPKATYEIPDGTPMVPTDHAQLLEDSDGDPSAVKESFRRGSSPPAAMSRKPSRRMPAVGVDREQTISRSSGAPHRGVACSDSSRPGARYRYTASFGAVSASLDLTKDLAVERSGQSHRQTTVREHLNRW